MDEKEKFTGIKIPEIGKGRILNQIAIISDLLEKANLTAKNITVSFDVEEDEFNRIYNTMYVNSKVKPKNPKNTFFILMGPIKFIFNKNNA